MAVNSSDLQVKDDLRKKLDAHEREIVKLQRQGKDILFKLSYELYLARNTCLDHKSEKTFSEWVTRFGFSRTSAYRAIARWEALAPKILKTPTFSGSCPTVGQSPPFEGFLCFARFDDSAIDELAKPSTPTKALNAAIKIAERGDGLTKKEAQELISKYTVPSGGNSGRPQTPPDTGTTDEPEPPSGGAGAAPGQDSGEISGESGDVCPNCGGSNYNADEDGMFCDDCKEPVGESDEEEEVYVDPVPECKEWLESIVAVIDRWVAGDPKSGIRSLDDIARILKEECSKRQHNAFDAKKKAAFEGLDAARKALAQWGRMVK